MYIQISRGLSPIMITNSGEIAAKYVYSSLTDTSDC